MSVSNLLIVVVLLLEELLDITVFDVLLAVSLLLLSGVLDLFTSDALVVSRCFERSFNYFQLSRR